MRKVFTKYDEPYKEIIVPHLRGFEATPLDDGVDMADMLGDIEYQNLCPVRKEEGLEGVTYIDYE